MDKAAEVMEKLSEPTEYEMESTNARRAVVLAEDMVHRIALRIADENARRRSADTKIGELHDALNALHTMLSALKVEDVSDGHIDDSSSEELAHALESADGALAVAQKLVPKGGIDSLESAVALAAEEVDKADKRLKSETKRRTIIKAER